MYLATIYIVYSSLFCLFELWGWTLASTLFPFKPDPMPSFLRHT